MDNKYFLKVSLMYILLGLFMSSCNLSLKDKNNEQIETKELYQSYTTKTNDDKQTLLEKKFKNCKLSDEYESDLIKGGSPILIPIESENKIYCTVNNWIMRYAQTSDDWKLLIPYEQTEWEKEPSPKYIFGVYKMKLKGKHLYCMFGTGACGSPGFDLAIEYLDLNDDTWHYVIHGNEDSEFIGDRIKVHVYWVIKEGSCVAENEYADSIKWIKME